MFWGIVSVLLVLTFGQVPAELIESKDFNEDAIGEVTNGSSRIIAGWEAYPGQFPYVAALRLITSGGAVRECAGSVVHRNWVLTVAHCTAGRISVVIRAGVTDITASPEYISETSKIWIHPSFNLNRPGFIQRTDISLLQVEKPFVYNKLVQPIRLQSRANAFANYANIVLIASGWGRLSYNGATPQVLNWVYLRGITNLSCRTAYGLFATLFDTNLCTRGQNSTSQSTCFGDNGGPLVHVQANGDPVLVGLAVFWFNNGCNARPAGFIRPGPFHNWLTSVTGLDFENLNEEDEVTETPKPPTTTVTEPSTVSETESTTVAETEPTTVSETEPTIVPETESTTVAVTKPTTVPETESTTVAVTEPTTVPETESTTVAVTEPTIVPETEPTTVAVTEPTAVPETESTIVAETESTTVAVTEPTTVPETESTTVAVTEPTTVPETESTTVAVTEPTTVPETESTTVAVTKPTTVPETESTTVAVTEPTIVPETESTTVAVTEPTAVPETESTTVAVTEPTTVPETESTTVAVTEPTTVTQTELTTVPETEPPPTEVTEPDNEQSNEDLNESDSSESEEDPDISELLNRLLVKIKVKVKVNNKIKKKKFKVK